MRIKGLIVLALWGWTAAPCRASLNDAEAEDSVRMVQGMGEVVIVHSPKETAELRKLPVAVSQLQGAVVENRHATSLKEISEYVPNVYMPDYGSGLTTAVYIRGVGSRANTPAVGLYVDNVGYADKSAYDIELYDVERVDVLRGPQATLYGRNAMGGLLRVFTRNPFLYQGVDVKMGTSVKDGGYRLSASCHQKAGSRSAFSLSAFYRNSDGFYDNDTRHETVGGTECGGGRARFIFLPAKDWKLDFATDYSYREDNGYPYRYLGVADEGEETMPESVGRIVYNRNSFYRRSLFNGSLGVQYAAPRVILSSVTAYQNLTDNMTLDQDFTGTDYFALSQRQRVNSYSEELTLKSRSNRLWEWTSGVYALRQTLHTKSPVSLTQTFMNTVLDEANTSMSAYGMSVALDMPSTAFVADGGFDTPLTDLAVFHQSTFNDLCGVDGLSLVVGLRVEYEKLSLDYDYGGVMDYDVSISSTVMPLNMDGLSDESRFIGSLSHDYVQWLPKVALQYSLNDRHNVYVSWSKGYRSGGYNVQMFSDLVQGDLKSRIMSSMRDKTEETLSGPAYDRMPDAVKQMIVGYIPQSGFSGSPVQTRYKPEYSYNYEAGGHFSFLDGTLQLDAAVFYMDVYDQQISKFVSSGLGRAMVNSGRGQSCGMEAAASGKLWQNRLSWRASYGYTHSVFKRYESGEGEDYDGNYVPFVPSHTMAAGIEYAQDVAQGKVKGFFAGVDVTGAGRIYWSEDNAYSQPFYALLNVHAGLDFGVVRIDVWGKNLTDTDYDTFFFTSSATARELKFGQSGNPLQFGVDVSIHI